MNKGKPRYRQPIKKRRTKPRRCPMRCKAYRDWCKAQICVTGAALREFGMYLLQHRPGSHSGKRHEHQGSGFIMCSALPEAPPGI